jgi:hypothetical protein
LEWGGDGADSSPEEVVNMEEMKENGNNGIMDKDIKEN